MFFVADDQRRDELEAALMSVADPKSLKYGRFWTREQIAAFTGSTQMAVEVLAYLRSKNDSGSIEITEQAEYGDYIKARAPVSVWESMFETEFHVFEQRLDHHDLSASATSSPPSPHEPSVRPRYRTLIRALDYKLPAALSAHVSTVLGTVQFPPRAPRKPAVSTPPPSQSDLSTPSTADAASTSEVPESHREEGVSDKVRSERSHTDIHAVDGGLKLHPNAFNGLYSGYVTPPMLNAVYQIPSNAGSTAFSQAVYSANGQGFSPTDLSTFQANYNLPNQPASDIGGYNDPAYCNANIGNCFEGNLDVQYVMAVAQQTPTTFWYDTNGDLASWLASVAASANPPSVISLSYGNAESDMFSGLGTFTKLSTYVKVFDNAAIKLALMGTTVLAASGDDGATGYRNSLLSICGYDPQWPASSPYVTAVGATQGPESGLPEVVCQGDTGGTVTSGGGFSTIYTTPS
jgi:subtilase family serine protease